MYDGVTCPKCGRQLTIIEPLQTTGVATAFQELRCNDGCNERFHEAWEMTELRAVDEDGRYLDDNNYAEEV